MTDAKIEKLEDYLLKLTEDIATVKAKLDVMDEVKDALDDLRTIQSEIDLLRFTVTTLENRVTRLEDKISEEEKYKKRSFVKTIITIFATIISGYIIDLLIK